MIRSLVLFTLLCCGNDIVRGQTQKNSVFTLDNGATVWYQIYSEVSVKDLKDQTRIFGTTEKSGNTIRRAMQDASGKSWLGFELHIDRVQGPAPIRFNLSMEPLGGWSFFGRKAQSREIRNGDRVFLDVIEEPGSGRKIFDTFSVGIGVAMQIMPMTRTVPQMPDPGTLIRLQNPQFKRNAAYGTDSIASNSSISGVTVAISAGVEGRFTFSSRPEPGFRMEAIAEGNRLMFVSGGDSFGIECAGPVIDRSVARYLWVRRDSDSAVPSGLPTLEFSTK